MFTKANLSIRLVDRDITIVIMIIQGKKRGERETERERE